MHRGNFLLLSASLLNKPKLGTVIEPVADYLRVDHYLDRCRLKGSIADTVFLYVVSYHFKW